MRKTIHKWFWAWDFEKEEKWLNEMSSIGLQLISVGFCTYIFEEGTPGEYTVRLQMLNTHTLGAEREKYIKFVEDTGAEYVGNVFRWVYFRKKTQGEEFRLFSDIDSRIRHLNGLHYLFSILAIANATPFLLNLYHFITRGVHSLSFTALAFGAFAVLLMVYASVRVGLIKRKLKRDRVLLE